MRLRGSDAIPHRLKIKFETANVAEVETEKVGCGIRTPSCHQKNRFTWGHLLIRPQMRTPRLLKGPYS